MSLFKAKFLESIMRTPSVWSFRFSCPFGFQFLPGQFCQVIFDETDINNKELNKYLSFSCAPGKSYLEITKRLSKSQFSDRLRSLKKDDSLLFKAPLGNCVFKPEYKKIAFLIGGIGITPVISIIEYVVEKRLDNDLHLVYSNRCEEEIAFREELDLWSSQGLVKTEYVVTDAQAKDKNCIFTRVNSEFLCNRIADLRERIIFIFGPPAMVEAMSRLCNDLGCSKEKIKVENFIGY